MNTEQTVATPPEAPPASPAEETEQTVPAEPTEQEPVDPARALRAEYTEIASIAAQAARLGVTVDAADAMRRALKPDAIRRSVLDALAERAEAQAIVTAAPTTAAPGDSPIVRRAKERAAASR